MLVVLTGFGSTQLPLGFETHTAMDLLMKVPMLPQNCPSSGFQDTSCANEIPLSAAMKFQVSPDLGTSGLRFNEAGRHMLPEVGNPRQYAARQTVGCDQLGGAIALRQGD